MAIYKLHLYKEFSTIVDVEAASSAEALKKFYEGDYESYPDWEEAGDEYASAITDPDGNEIALQDGELP